MRRLNSCLHISHGTLSETVGVAPDTTAAHLQLGSNPYYRDLTDTVVLTTQAQDLPDMHGSGWVRDLREAMSLGLPQRTALAAKVQDFANANTKDAQMALVGQTCWKCKHVLNRNKRDCSKLNSCLRNSYARFTNKTPVKLQPLKRDAHQSTSTGCP